MRQKRHNDMAALGRKQPFTSLKIAPSDCPLCGEQRTFNRVGFF
jgi:hypothetical protein